MKKNYIKWNQSTQQYRHAWYARYIFVRIVELIYIHAKITLISRVLSFNWKYHTLLMIFSVNSCSVFFILLIRTPIQWKIMHLLCGCCGCCYCCCCWCGIKEFIFSSFVCVFFTENKVNIFVRSSIWDFRVVVSWICGQLIINSRMPYRVESACVCCTYLLSYNFMH